MNLREFSQKQAQLEQKKKRSQIFREKLARAYHCQQESSQKKWEENKKKKKKSSDTKPTKTGNVSKAETNQPSNKICGEIQPQTLF